MSTKTIATVILYSAGCALLILFVTYLLISCTPLPTAAQQEDVAAYEAEQLACVASYSTRKEIDVCRDMVRARHGRLDAGAHE